MTERQQWVMCNFNFLKQYIKRESINKKQFQWYHSQSHSWCHSSHILPLLLVMVSRPLDYESDVQDTDLGPAVYNTVIMHDASEETSSSEPSQVIKK